MENVIVTGANGFIGKTLVNALLAKGCRVTALDVRFDDVLADDPRVTCISVLNKDVPALAAEIPAADYHCFFHLAWAGTSGPARADYDVQLANVKLTCDFIKLCAEVGCKRVVYASSINEMETYEYLQSDDIDPAGGYIYGTGKLAAHLMGETVAKLTGVEFIPVIITNIYGVGEKSARMIYTAIRKLIHKEHCSFTAGYQTYDFIYITDAINAIIAVAEKGKPFNRYYIGSGEPKPLREFLLEMRDLVDPEAEIGLGDLPFKGVNVSYDQFDLKKVERDTGYVNQIPFAQGIKMTADYIREEHKMVQKFDFQPLDLQGAYLIKPFYATDNRGGLIKDYNVDTFRANGIDHDLKEVFYTISKRGVIRATHFQLVKQQAKLVRCISGHVYDVIVDLRPDSPTFGQWRGFHLTGENTEMLLVPQYFGHGYLVIEDSVVSYKCAEVFYGEGDSGIMYNDPDISIDWPFELIGGKENLIISEKDLHLMSFADYKKL